MITINHNGQELTVVSVRFSNEEQTGAFVLTTERGEIMLSQQDTPVTWQNLMAANIEVDGFTVSIEELKDNLVTVRQGVEYGGITLNGMTIPSDEKTEGRIGRAYTKALNDPNYTIDNWTTDGGATSFTLTAAMIIAIGDALDAHIQKCFSVNVAVTAQIVSGALTTKAQVEAAFAAGMAA